MYSVYSLADFGCLCKIHHAPAVWKQNTSQMMWQQYNLFESRALGPAENRQRNLSKDLPCERFTVNLACICSCLHLLAWTHVAVRENRLYILYSPDYTLVCALQLVKRLKYLCHAAVLAFRFVGVFRRPEP